MSAHANRPARNLAEASPASQLALILMALHSEGLSFEAAEEEAFGRLTFPRGEEGEVWVATLTRHRMVWSEHWHELREWAGLLTLALEKAARLRLSTGEWPAS